MKHLSAVEYGKQKFKIQPKKSIFAWESNNFEPARHIYNTVSVSLCIQRFYYPIQTGIMVSYNKI